MDCFLSGSCRSENVGQLIWRAFVGPPQRVTVWAEAKDAVRVKKARARRMQLAPIFTANLLGVRSEEASVLDPRRVGSRESIILR
jgi:hypothetical protein